MKLTLNVEGSNQGGSFVQKYAGQVVDLQSLYKNIEINSPPLAQIKTEDGNTFSFQFVDVRFIDENVFIYGYLMDAEDKNGGKVLLRFTK
jgi:hypothetical protein